MGKQCTMVATQTKQGPKQEAYREMARAVADALPSSAGGSCRFSDAVCSLNLPFKITQGKSRQALINMLTPGTKTLDDSWYTDKKCDDDGCKDKINAILEAAKSGDLDESVENMLEDMFDADEKKRAEMFDKLGIAEGNLEQGDRKELKKAIEQSKAIREIRKGVD